MNNLVKYSFLYVTRVLPSFWKESMQRIFHTNVSHIVILILIHQWINQMMWCIHSIPSIIRIKTVQNLILLKIRWECYSFFDTCRCPLLFWIYWVIGYPYSVLLSWWVPLSDLFEHLLLLNLILNFKASMLIIVFKFILVFFLRKFGIISEFAGVRHSTYDLFTILKLYSIIRFNMFT